MKLTYSFVTTLAQFYLRFFHDLRIDGLYNIPGPEKSYLFVCNHVSYLDPPLVGSIIPYPVHFLARKTLFDKPWLNWILSRCYCIAVDQERPDMTALKRMIGSLRQGRSVVVFPEGARSVDGQLLKGQPGVGLIVAKTQVDVVPMRVFGGHLAWPRGGKIQPFTPVELVIGKPLEYKDLHKSKSDSYQDISDRIMNAIAAIEPST